MDSRLTAVSKPELWCIIFFMKSVQNVRNTVANIKAPTCDDVPHATRPCDILSNSGFSIHREKRNQKKRRRIFAVILHAIMMETNNGAPDKE